MYIKGKNNTFWLKQGSTYTRFIVPITKQQIEADILDKEINGEAENRLE